MAFRSFRHVPTNALTDRIDGSADATFGSPDAVALAEVAAATGLPEAEFVVEVSDTEPVESPGLLLTPTLIIPTAAENAHAQNKADTAASQNIPALRQALQDHLDAHGDSV